ncbi:MAG TPA: hypothetical protein VL981_10905 [Candidatus Methylacidiphilales bacterium]|nr:hypothetical protein [Candidatus Methylacidiphilales bacterium]
MSSNWQAAIGVFLVFAFGCISGWLGSSAVHVPLLQRGPDAVTALWENRLTRNLDLNENQKREIHQFFLQNLAQRRELQKQIAPQVVTLNHATLKQIISVLSPDQVARFRRNVAFFRQQYAQGPFNERPDNQLTPRANGQMPVGSKPTNALEDTPASNPAPAQ